MEDMKIKDMMEFILMEVNQAGILHIERFSQCFP